MRRQFGRILERFTAGQRACHGHGFDLELRSYPAPDAGTQAQRLKLGIDAGETSVSKCTVRRRKTSSIGTNGARPETYAPGYRTERATG
jgi:hypothetical protein